MHESIYLPSGQVSHKAYITSGVYVPGVHGIAIAEPTGQNDPAGQTSPVPL